MNNLKEEVKDLIEKHGALSISALQFQILNIKEEKYPSLGFFKVSRGWVGKQKTMTLKPRPKSIVTEVNEKQLLKWFKKRKSNILTSLVTTGQMKTKYHAIR